MSVALVARALQRHTQMFMGSAQTRKELRPLTQSDGYAAANCS